MIHICHNLSREYLCNMDFQPEVRKQNKGTQHNFSIDATLKFPEMMQIYNN